MNQGLISGITDEFKPCGCGMNASCGECLRKERRRRRPLAVLWVATVLVILFVTALSLAVGASL